MLLRSEEPESAEVSSLGSSEDSAEAKAPSHRSLKDVVKALSQSTASISSSLTSDVSDSVRSDYSCSMSSITNSTATNGGDNVSITTRDRVAEREMFNALAARKDALIERLKEKTEELRKICIQEAELTGEYPSETPYNGNPLPPIRRRVKTAFEFSNFIVDGEGQDDEFDDEDDGQLQREIEIQAAITSAAEKLAHDRKQNKKVRKSRKLNYQQSLRKLKTMEELLEWRKRSDTLKSRNDEEQDKKSTDSLDTGIFLSHRGDSPDGNYTEIVEKVASHRYRHTVNMSIGSRKGSTGSYPDDEEFDDEPLNGRYFSAKDYPPSPSSRRSMDYQYHNGQVHNGTRQGPAFHYSDSDTRSDSSTKLSSMSSSYGNCEEFMDNSEPFRANGFERSHYRRVVSSTDNLAHDYSNPRLVVTRPTARSSESVFSDGDDARFSPTGAPLSKRSFSCSASNHVHPSHKGVTYVTAKYLNSSDLGIVSNAGSAGSYSVNHGGGLAVPNASGRSLATKGSFSTSLLAINRTENNLRSTSHGNLKSAMSQVSMNRPYLRYPDGLYRNRSTTLTGLSASDELLEWANEETSEATLV